MILLGERVAVAKADIKTDWSFLPVFRNHAQKRSNTGAVGNHHHCRCRGRKMKSLIDYYPAFNPRYFLQTIKKRGTQPNPMQHDQQLYNVYDLRGGVQPLTAIDAGITSH